MWVILTRDYTGCNCSCFEVDQVLGPFRTEAEAEAYGKNKYGRYGDYRVRYIDVAVG